MVEREKQKKQSFLLNIVYFSLIFLLIWILFKYLIGWIMPFILGFLIAALVQPAVSLLHNRLRLSRRAAGVLAVLFFMIVLSLILSLCVTKAVSELAAVTKLLPGLFEQLAGAVARISARISVYVDSLPVDYANKIYEALENISQQLMRLSSLSSGTVSFVFNVISKVPGLMLNIIVTIVSACFISMDYGDIRGFILRQLQPRYQEMACDIKAFLFNTIAKLIRAYLKLMAITFAELLVGLMAIGVPHAVTIAALIAIVDIMPVLGTGTVMIPWALIELVLGNIYLAVCLSVLYVIILIVRNILEPKIVGNHIGLYPLITLMAMFVGLQIFGFTGMILFPIIIIIVKHLQDSGKIRLWKE